MKKKQQFEDAHASEPIRYDRNARHAQGDCILCRLHFDFIHIAALPLPYRRDQEPCADGMDPAVRI